jgi:hypothetical protein
MCVIFCNEIFSLSKIHHSISHSKNIRNYYIPLEKWLKYRIKDRTTLNISDLEHLQKMITTIKNTVSIMQEVNKLEEEYLK